MQKTNPKKEIVKRQTQRRPGLEKKMDPQPVFYNASPGSFKLQNKKCIITGGDSGIGRAVAVAFAKEGADVAIVYLKSEEADARITAMVIKELYKKNCILEQADISKEKNCVKVIQKLVKKMGGVDVLVNNAGLHYAEEDITKATTEHLIETFETNFFSIFWLTKEVLKFMKSGGNIINTSSVVAYRGSGHLMDYSATKGAIVSFTRSLSANLAAKGIRVNSVAPGPVWTPLIASSFEGKKVASFGTDTPMKRPAQPVELAPAFVFLASDDASYITGQTIHVNGGEIVNG